MPTTKEKINKMGYTRKTEYYLAIKSNEALIHATTLMNLENIMLNERKQTQKTTYCVILFI